MSTWLSARDLAPGDGIRVDQTRATESFPTGLARVTRVEDTAGHRKIWLDGITRDGAAAGADEGIDLRRLRSELHELWMREGGGSRPDPTETGELAARADRAIAALAYRVQCVDRPCSERETRSLRRVDTLAADMSATRDYLTAIVERHERHDHAAHDRCDAFTAAVEALGRLSPSDHHPHDFRDHRGRQRAVDEIAGMCRRYGERAAAARVDADRAIQDAVASDDV